MSSSSSAPQAAWADLAPGVELGRALESLDLPGMEEFDLVEAVRACERQIAYAQAMQARLVRELSRREDYAVCGACEDTELLNPLHQHDRAVATGQEVGAALTLPPGVATNHTAVSIALVEQRPHTLTALQAGRITLGKARVIVEGVRWLDDPWLEAEVEDRLLEAAPAMTERQLKRRLNRMLMQTDPDTVKKRHDDGRKRRRVCPPTPDDDTSGIASMYLVGPAEDLTALYTAVDAASRSMRSGGDSRTLGQLRFDVLCGIGWAALSTGVLTGVCTSHPEGRADGQAGTSPTRTSTTGTNTHTTAGAAATVRTGATDETAASAAGTSAASTHTTGTEADGESSASATHPKANAESSAGATGTGEATAGTANPGQQGPFAQSNPNSHRCGCVRLARRHGRPAQVNVTVPITTLLGMDDQPAELAGYGPIPAHVARRIAGDATWKRMLTDPADGRLLEYGRTTYTPPQELADFVLARDTRCVFPTCDTPSTASDIDHAHPWHRGGTTGASNTQPVSRACHTGKTLHGWTLEHTDSGHYRWLSPAGRTYTVPPEAVGAVRPFATRHQRRDHPATPEPPPF